MSTRQFGHHTLPTADAAYRDGYRTGARWRESYTPGGPLVFAVRQSDDAEFRAYCAATAENNREWLRGFADARKAAR